MKTLLACSAAIALVTLVGVDRVLVTPLHAEDRAAAVLAEVRTALGGEQKLAAVKAISVEGPFRRAMGARSLEGSISLLLVRPDKLRRSEELQMLGSTTERIATYDGAQAWEDTVNAARVGGSSGGGFDHGAGGTGALSGQAAIDHAQAMAQFRSQTQGETAGGPGGALTEEQVNAARVRRLKMDLQRWTVALLADSNQPFTDAGRVESPDGPADVLSTLDEAGRAVRYFVDPASHLPLMVQYQEVRPQAMPAQDAPKPTTIALHLSDYKKVDGILLPHQIDRSVDGRPSEAWTIEKYKINPTVKPDVFKKKAK
jgi:hypothetical protein